MHSFTLHGMNPGKRTALVVEDDNVSARLLQFVLQREGYAVRRLETGRDVRACMAAGDAGIPSLITLDCMLPDESGLDVLGAIRGTPQWRDVPVLLITGRSAEQDDVQLALDGDAAAAYMAKPFNPRGLSEQIRRFA